MDPQKRRAVFWDVHSGLPREGPGSAETTKRALELAAPVPDPRMSWISRKRSTWPACSPRRRFGPSIRTNRSSTRRTGERPLSGLAIASKRFPVTRGRCSFRIQPSTPFGATVPPNSWVSRAHCAWKPVPRPTPAGSPSARLFGSLPIRSAKPSATGQIIRLSGHGGCAPLASVVRTSGYELLGDFVLPQAAWRECYTPMQERLRVLAPKYAGDADAETLKDCADEIAATGTTDCILAKCFW
jgi:hypothetical protein